MNQVNFQKELEKILKKLPVDDKKTLLLHSCCAPCSSYCLVYLRQYFNIVCLYYNPNITEQEEYEKRVKELYRLVEELSNDPIGLEQSSSGGIALAKKDIEYLDSCGTLSVISGEYDPEFFISRVRNENLTGCPEGGDRCKMCFDMRLSEAARVAASVGCDYYTTSLTISPLKNALILNQIGNEIALSYNELEWLPTDFKKRGGYQLSVELCKRYDMYRQDYCGCVYSKR